MDELTITTGDDRLALMSLHAWLERDAELATHAELRMNPARGTGTLNAAETIGLVVSGVAAVAQLVDLCRRWRDARDKSPAVTITITVGPADDAS